MVYGGIYEPGHPTADADGWRGTCSPSCASWASASCATPAATSYRDTTGRTASGRGSERPTRLELAWHSLESNEVGTDDFLAWARLAQVEPMLTVNLGTRGVDAARSFVEYCNAPPGSRYADLRVANGHADPYGVRTWCLGNELDGPWQIGQKTAEEYGRLAAETGKAMRLVDPAIELVLAGSSGPAMPTFGRWDDTVLDLAWDVTDYLSVHSYLDRADYPDVDAYLACALGFERTIGTIIATVDAVAARKQSRKRVDLSVDEWNVWHHTENPTAASSGPVRSAPAIAEDEHDIADALVVGSLLITLLRHADRVRIACLAQLVNAIAPIRTADLGPAGGRRPSIPSSMCPASGAARCCVWSHPARRITSRRRGRTGRGSGRCPGRRRSALTIFLVNRIAAEVPLRAVIRELGPLALVEHLELSGPDLRPRTLLPPRGTSPPDQVPERSFVTAC